MNNYSFEIACDYNISISQTEENGIFAIFADFTDKAYHEPIKIKWHTPGKGIFTRWNALGGQDRSIKPNWSKFCNDSRVAYSIPIQCYLAKNGQNKITVAVSDIKTMLNLRSGITEESAELEWELNVFLEEGVKKYEAKLLICTEDIPYEQSLRRVCDWWANLGFGSSCAPENAFDAVYSTWYSYHQNITSDALLRELNSAKKLGMKTVIIDDGWQTDDSNRGYAFCGDWELAKTKLPDMKSFTDSVHGLGMKLLLWYGVPLIGIKAKMYDKFKNKVLNPEAAKTHYVLDPRYPDVRDYLIRFYENAVIDWGIDGFKLDFIDSFCSEPDTPPYNPQMDCVTVEDGTLLFLEEVYNRLIAKKPDILIEFRQGYIGPAMQKYGNMLRAADCPADSVTNRISIVNLRLTSGNCAVHSDMLMWDKNDSVEFAADQLINVLFSVPQISVKIDELCDSHYKMLKFYLAFWEENKDVILHGTLSAKSPEANYSMVSAKKDSEAVTVAYAERVLTLDKTYDKLSFVNGTGYETLYIDNSSCCDTRYNMKIYSCTGEILSDTEVIIKNGVTAFNVPVSGVMVLNR